VRACPECHTPYPDDQAICPLDGQDLAAGKPGAPALAATVPTRDERSPAPSPIASARRLASAAAAPRSISVPIVISDDGEGEILGQTLGSFRVLSILGKGGMGRVYLAEHIKLGRRVALKVLRPEFSVKRDAVGRFFQEAKAVSRIRHKNIVDVTDFVEAPDGITFIVMELLEGITLGEKFRRHLETPLREALEIGIQVCDGLDAAHREGIIHRDLKPDNIFLAASGSSGGDSWVKLLDFGVAKLMGEADAGWQTMQGSVVGTPAYMSPEQAAGIACDHRADLYSLGTILYEMLTGRRVFEAKSFGEFVLKHMSHDPIPPREIKGAPPLPRELERSVLRCLEKRPEDRFQTASELRMALVESLASLETASVDGHVARAKRRRAFYLGLSLGAAGIAIVLTLLLTVRSSGPESTLAGAGVEHTAPGTASGVAPGPSTPVVEQLPMPRPRRGVVVRFHSEPEGAHVVNEAGVVIGDTPLIRELEADGRVHEFSFHRDGFRDKRMRVPCDQDRTVLAILERSAAPPAPARPSDHARPEPVARPEPPARAEPPARPPGKSRVDEHVTVDPFKEK